MATAKAAGEAAAKKTSAKAANAAKAPADKPAKGKAAAADKAPAKPAAAPAKQAAKPAKAEATEGRRGRPSGLDEAAKIKKGSVDFKEHVRAETVRFALMKAIVDGVGKTIGDVLGQKIDDDHVIKSVDVRFAIENQYIAI